MISLSGQIILITGASSGIGAALAEILAQQHSGIKLILAARNLSLLETVANKCLEAGAEVLVVPTDLSKIEEVRGLVQKSLEVFDRVDILVNNAGYGQMGPIELIPPESSRQQLDVNFYAPLILIQALIPVMRNNGGGKIINVSSLGGRIPFPIAGMYSCSKFALEALSDVLRMELKAFNIQVAVIEPGPIVTEFFRVAWEEVQQSIPNYQQTIYAPVFDNIAAIDSQLNLLGWSASKTAKAIAKIIPQSRLRPRYVLATGGNMLIFIMNKVLPTWARDEFWKRFYGVDKVEKQWQKTNLNM